MPWALYNWHTVAQNNLYPQGWHVPTKEDWDKLIEFINIGYHADNQALNQKKGGKIMTALIVMDLMVYQEASFLGADFTMLEKVPTGGVLLRSILALLKYGV